jgi:DNA-binding CsgD family transcriptional regulator
MDQLTRLELRGVLDVLHAIGENWAGSDDFSRRGVDWLPRLVGSDLTTFSVCDLDAAHRSVVTDQPGAIAPGELEVFDRHLFKHPLVRAHGRNPAAMTARINDLQSESVFRRTPLYNEYYRAIRIDYVMAIPIHVDNRFLVGFVLNRSHRRFSDRDRELAEIVRPHLANLYCLSIAIERRRRLRADASFERSGGLLTPREREVLDWVAAGKTNRDIAAILGASPRTVEKHLERIYEKLGVETRTAAVMRISSGISRRAIPRQPDLHRVSPSAATAIPA